MTDTFLFIGQLLVIISLIFVLLAMQKFIKILQQLNENIMQVLYALNIVLDKKEQDDPDATKDQPGGTKGRW